MKFFHMSIARSLAPALFLTSTVMLSAAGVAHAQYDTSGQRGSSAQGNSAGSSSGQGGSSGTSRGQDRYPQPSDGGGPYGIVKDDMDMGYVDQKKRDERNRDSASPSKDTHVPNFPVDKQGRPLKDLSKEQGGSIGPN